ncbi:TlpA family protein disulfide reductase [Halanaerobacter jeridensis]|uniref:Peroxiredoxin n=1 Tax=Halanaerobacter jeridensis TaxID=706427 RepID=A0A938XXJ7_9FIRM|nr:TlpA disulfide reductase family protein [Halanaerobacter jeridensis]MBM7557492.1 peroxiredoxin [Halanaerobacter jeridensis]
MHRQSTAAKKTTLPQIKLKTLEGKKTSLHQLSTPTLILFYLPQSVTCQQQLKILSELQQQSPQLKIIAIAIGDIKTDKLLQLKKEDDIHFTFLIDTTAQFSEKLQISTIPTLVFYHPSKKLKFKEGLSKEKALSKSIRQELIANN